jgi:hypothetical protein
MGHPTYWPSDVHKIPDLVDFCVTKVIPPDFAIVHSCLDLSSDHSPILVTLTSQAIRHDPPQSLSNRSTNLDYFKHLINHRLLLQIPLKTTDYIEAASKLFTDTLQWADWKATPALPAKNRIHDCPLMIKQKLAEKQYCCLDHSPFKTWKTSS